MEEPCIEENDVGIVTVDPDGADPRAITTFSHKVISGLGAPTDCLTRSFPCFGKSEKTAVWMDCYGRIALDGTSSPPAPTITASGDNVVIHGKLQTRYGGVDLEYGNGSALTPSGIAQQRIINLR
jgi:hypothetical protein